MPCYLGFELKPEGDERNPVNVSGNFKMKMLAKYSPPLSLILNLKFCPHKFSKSSAGPNKFWTQGELNM
jgi:hypothetical protein